MPPAPLCGAMVEVGCEAAWAPFERCSGAVSGRLEEVQSRILLGRVKATLCLGTGIGDRQDCRDDVLGLGRRHPLKALQQRRRVYVGRRGPGPDLLGQTDELRDAGRAGAHHGHDPPSSWTSAAPDRACSMAPRSTS